MVMVEGVVVVIVIVKMVVVVIVVGNLFLQPLEYKRLTKKDMQNIASKNRELSKYIVRLFQPISYHKGS